MHVNHVAMQEVTAFQIPEIRTLTILDCLRELTDPENLAFYDWLELKTVSGLKMTRQTTSSKTESDN